MIKNDQLNNTIKTILCEAVQQDVDISFSTSLLEAGIIDSLTVLSFVFGLEEYFNIEIKTDDLEIENIESIEKVARMLTERYL